MLLLLRFHNYNAMLHSSASVFYNTSNLHGKPFTYYILSRLSVAGNAASLAVATYIHNNEPNSVRLQTAGSNTPPTEEKKTRARATPRHDLHTYLLVYLITVMQDESGDRWPPACPLSDRGSSDYYRKSHYIEHRKRKHAEINRALPLCRHVYHFVRYSSCAVVCDLRRLHALYVYLSY
jgi:hypothetical protein